MRIILFAALLLACSPIPAQQIYDLLLKNGRVIDPANHRDAQLDVAVIGKQIVRVAPNLPAAHARVAVDAGGYIVTPGLIDLNTHFGPTLKPDHNTLPYGVTTAVDAGSATCKTFADFKTQVIDRAKVGLLAFLSATDIDCTSRVVRQNQETIAGIAATPETLEAALAAAQASGTILMLNGAAWSEQLRAGDISSHVYSRLTPTAFRIEEARRRGILFDSAEGTDGLWFRIAQPAIAQKLLPGHDFERHGLSQRSAAEGQPGHLDVDLPQPGNDRGTGHQMCHFQSCPGVKAAAAR